jgi:hypothetical protein
VGLFVAMRQRRQDCQLRIAHRLGDIVDDEPSPKIVTSSPRRACTMKFDTTRPSFACMR